MAGVLAVGVPACCGESSSEAAIMGNALQHGHGRVLVSTRQLGEALPIDAADSEDLFRRGTSGGSGSGIELALTRSRCPEPS